MNLPLKRFTLALILAFFPYDTTKAELILKDVRPGESGVETYEKTLVLSSALEYLNQIKSSLQSFKALTEVSKALIQENKARSIGNLNPEMQNIGFQNMPQIIEGVLRKQNYLIKKLQLALLEERYKTGKTRQEELKNAELELSSSEQDFIAFWNELSLVD
ncbi:MAG: hypothetical protein GYA55_03195 [SAR324 cluster bacterium]|uniref:Uncharacterized protein n=1 Tax=SAR324 cluster bacterium TaxID=2024889 RepID=A0A7X9FQ67_9DELT|nr:hypothetical protein [SAR324 cluster bacterium]